MNSLNDNTFMSVVPDFAYRTCESQLYHIPKHYVISKNVTVTLFKQTLNLEFCISFPVQDIHKVFFPSLSK